MYYQSITFHILFINGSKCIFHEYKSKIIKNVDLKFRKLVILIRVLSIKVHIQLAKRNSCILYEYNNSQAG